MNQNDSIPNKNKDFFDLVYQVVRLIPYGRVSSYGAIAKYLGSARGARMVGWAMNACMNREDVPAHRVVNRMGVLSGKMHFATPDTMENRLKEEGIEVMADQIQHFDSVFWDPGKELEL